MKTIIIGVLVGALSGMLVASLAVPPALSWYTTPGGLPQGTQIQALVEIPSVIQYATGRLIRWQMIFAGIGAVVGLLVALALARRGRPADVLPSPANTGQPAAPDADSRPWGER
jgi:hypothetical protein